MSNSWLVRFFAVGMGCLSLGFCGTVAANAQAARTPATPAAPPPAWMNATLDADKRADLMIHEMTLDEKIQLVHGAGWGVLRAGAPVATGHNGGAGFVPGIPRLHLPDINLADSAVGVRMAAPESRYATLLPSVIGMAASWDPDAAFLYGSVIGRELRAQGYNMSIGGGMDLVREPRNGRNFEYASEDPILSGVMVGQVARGVQSNHVMGDIKHYAVNDQETGRNILNAVLDKRTLRETDLLAFQIAITMAHPAGVMCAYNHINGDYSCENDYALNQVLKKDWGFQGFVLSDWGGTHSTVKAALAGLDMDQPGDDNFFSDPLKKAVQDGTVPQARLDDMVHRIVRSMFVNGVIDQPPMPRSVVDPFRGRDDAQKIEEESLVLLQNTGGILPLTAAKTKSIALIGGHADVAVLSGGGSAQVDSPGGNAIAPGPGSSPWGRAIYFPSSPMRYIREQAATGTNITYDAGSDPAAAAKAAASAQVAIVFVTLWMGEGNQLTGTANLSPGEWHLLAASFDGSQFHLYFDGHPASSGMLSVGSINPVLQMAPPTGPGLAPGRHFGGQIASFTLLRHALSDTENDQLYRARPDFSLIQFEAGSKPWPFQTRGQAGYRAPQPPATMPTSRAPFSAPVAITRPLVVPAFTRSGDKEWTISEGWTMREAPKVDADGAQISTAAFNNAGYDASGWMRATVPGTVLTTLVDNGVYPDPGYGLNNLAIPESLNKQDYWYRAQFSLTASLLPPGAHAELTFEGINYAASVWLNGKLLGTMKGAFRRGSFDVTSALKPGQNNVLAVRISPPPHPGIPQEQSILGGPGENGGTMELDGPTFLATEGWDWIPAVRDRNSGIWQPVTLRITQGLKLGDAQVVTTFKNHDTTRAAIEIDVPVTNLSSGPIDATLAASIEKIAVRKSVTLPPGDSVVKLTPAEFPQLNLDHPRLWWPNGYGKPEMYSAKLSADTYGVVSDTKTVRFGVREISYELSLLDSSGHLRRVQFTPSAAREAEAATPIVDVSHEGMLEVPLPEAEAANMPEERRANASSHVASLTPGAENSPAIQPLTDLHAAPYLVLRVNGVRIAARGGNWGMDDFRKRVSREHLEPFFRLNRDAGLNIIRNWVGQSTEESFYQLADEYGMMVWNDFWESTENYNIEAEDPQLFLANAADTIQRFRNHPSIVMWCGRNEGVPQPIINLGLDKLVRTLDGTRYYSPSSNAVNLAGSGPYRYQVPAQYFTTLNRGFSVETGTPSMSTLESFQSTVPKADQWPIDDVWAYHDWHQSGNGDVAPFMAEIQTEFGAPTSLEDFERKAQMLNYVDHRAIFEGMDANLWAPNSGRLLWMTQPAWPSTMWQILSSDYDTQASFYGVKKACEPLHVQLNLANYRVDVVNTTTAAHNGLTVSAKAYSLANALLFQAMERKDTDADSTTPSLRLDLEPYLAKGMVLVSLELHDAQGALVSQNLYWLGARPASYRELNSLAPTQLKASATSTTAGDTVKLTIQLTNSASVVSLENKLTLLNAGDKQRILPAYYSDNYISLLPGESRTIQVEYPSAAAHGPAQIALRGWNAVPQAVPVK